MQEPPARGRRERRKAETRQRLLEAASRLFAERGFEGTRPQDIARAADVAIGTFYVHFSDRRDAFQAFTARAAAELMERARARAGEAAGFEQRLAAYLEALLDYADEKPGVLRAAFADEAVISSAVAGPPGEGGDGGSLRERLARGLARGLQLGMDRGELAFDYDPMLVSHGMVGLIQQALTYGTHRGLDRQGVIESITRFCGRALVARPAAAKESSP